MRIDIREKIQTSLLTISSEVYYEDAPDDAVYPYIVLNIPDGFFDGASTTLDTIEVDVWDQSDSSIQSETLRQSIIDTLDGIVYLVNANFSIRLVFDRRMDIDDPDDRIKRKKSNFQIRSMTTLKGVT